MQARSFESVIKSSLISGMILLLIGGTATLEVRGNDRSIVNEGPMDTLYETESPAIPPIDAAAPSDFQTASFGLG